MCGALLSRPNDAGDTSVSPHASTIPLSGVDPATDALSPHDTGSPNPPRTSDLRRGEIDELLLRLSDAEPQPTAGNASPLAPVGDNMREDQTTDDSRPLSIRVRPIEHDGALVEGARNSSLDANSDSNPSARLAVASVDDATSKTSPVPVALAVAPPSDEIARPRRSREARAMGPWAGAAIFCVLALVVATGVVLAWYELHKLRSPSGASAASIAATPAADAKQAVASKLKEADELIAAGRADEATARLREASTLDPADAEPHRRLARLLLAGGSRRTAIEELQAVTRLAPEDAAAWRELAAAQFAEGDYAAAAGSYHTLFGLANDATADDHLQLAYADALRLSGRTREAQSLYKRLANSRVGEVARASRQQLSDANANESKNENTNTNANVNRAQTAGANANSSNSAAHEGGPTAMPRASDAGGVASQPRTSPTTLPADASPRDHYERGVQLWRTNRAAALVEFGAAAQHGNADADYYLGLNLAEGREPRALKRGELIAALGYFQSARRSHFSADARRYEDALAKEYDRRRNDNR
jgi:DNA-binding SARP family transcriptional activator